MNEPMLNRAAMRCLLDERAGQLSVLDQATGRAHSRPVRYEPAAGGAFVAMVSNAEDLLDVIRGGGAVSLEIRRPATDQPTADECGAPTPDAVGQVTAHVDAHVLDEQTMRLGRAAQSLVKLRLMVRALSVALQQPAAA